MSNNILPNIYKRRLSNSSSQRTIGSARMSQASPINRGLKGSQSQVSLVEGGRVHDGSRFTRPSSKAPLKRKLMADQLRQEDQMS